MSATSLLGSVSSLVRPWLAPELTSIHRQPMHSVPHADRIELDGSWRFQLLREPDAAPGPDWSTATVPGCWTMQGFDDRPQYTNIQMPFTGRPPEVPADNPTGLYERTVDVPSSWADRRIVLHVGGAESVLIVRVNDAEVGLSKDSHLAAEFDVSSVVRPGPNTITLRVIKWSDATYIEDQDQWWHGGITRSVYLYATEPVYLADVRAIGGLADDLRTGTLDLQVRVGFAGDPAPGWRVEASIGNGAGVELRAEAPASSVLEWFWTGPEADLMFGHVVGGDAAVADDIDRWAELWPRLQPPAEGSVGWRIDVADIEPWSSEVPTLYPLTVRLLDPTGRVVEEAVQRIGFRRVEVRGLDLLINGRRVLIRGVNRHDFDQHTGRVVSPRIDAGRPRPDAAVRVQCRPDIALSERPRAPRPGRRARPVRHRRGGHRIPRVPEHALRRPALSERLGDPGIADGRARQEPSLRHRLVAGQRVGLRAEPRRGGRLGPSLRPDPAPPLRGRHPFRLDERPDRQRRDLPDVPDDRVDRRPRADRVGSATR